jgi:hypothetical protein
MTEMDFHAELLVDVFGHMLGTIDGAMATTCASKGDLQMGETTLDVAGHMEIDETIDALEESENLTILLEEVDDGLIETCKGLVLVVATRIVSAAAVEDITTSVARLVDRNALLEGEGEDRNTKSTLSNSPCEGEDSLRDVAIRNVGLVVLQIGLHLGFLGLLFCPTLFLLSIKGNEGFCHFLQIGISIASAKGDFLRQIADGKGDAVGEIGFLLPKTSIAVSA